MRACVGSVCKVFEMIDCDVDFINKKLLTISVSAQFSTTFLCSISVPRRNESTTADKREREDQGVEGGKRMHDGPGVDEGA